MGRGKLTMELIGNEKKREKTFLKRKKGLIKKALEFTTLTGLKMGIIIYGPRIGTASDPPPPEIWPDDCAQLRAVVDEFNAKRSRGVKACLLPDYFVKRCKTYRDTANNLRKANYAARFARWFDWFNDLSVPEIGALIGKLDSVHENAIERIVVLKNMKNQMIVPTATDQNHYCSFDQQNQSFLELLVNPEMVPGISRNFMISHGHHLQQHYREQAQQLPQFLAQPNPFEYSGPNFTYPLDGSAATRFPFSGLVGSATPNELTAAPPLLPAPASYHHHAPSMEPLKLEQWQPPPLAPPSSLLSIISSRMHFNEYCLPARKRSNSRLFH